ncbi:hypothetical protein OBDJBBDK_00120 [Aeromonas phage AhFM11]|nr:hypothetical protein OBDJBBDK_00120 [Aeromonas phage AhFM11]
MMFADAKAMINKETNIAYDGIEYADTFVGDMLGKIEKYHGPGDAYNVTYRQLIAGGNVIQKSGIASYEWLVKIGFQPGIELVSVNPTISTSVRWALVYSGIS